MITSASTYCFISDGSTCRLLTTSPIGLLLFSTFSSFLIGRRCPGRDDGGYVRLADQLVEGRFSCTSMRATRSSKSSYSCRVGAASALATVPDKVANLALSLTG